jgi:hypothetical protein
MEFSIMAFKPVDWDNIAIPSSSISGGTISAAPIRYDYNLPGELLDYVMRHDLDLLEKMDKTQLEVELKRDMAVKLAEKMMEDGHIVFTKQAFPQINEMRYRAYTWVGEKNFIEQQRKSK